MRVYWRILKILWTCHTMNEEEASLELERTKLVYTRKTYRLKHSGYKIRDNKYCILQLTLNRKMKKIENFIEDNILHENVDWCGINSVEHVHIAANKVKITLIAYIWNG